jgi:hypothetical protein
MAEYCVIYVPKGDHDRRSFMTGPFIGRAMAEDWIKKTCREAYWQGSKFEIRRLLEEEASR